MGDVEIRINGLPTVLAALDDVVLRLTALEEQVAADLSRLTSEVSENTSVIQSAITLLGGLAAEIRANAADQTALNELADTLDAQSNALAAAVAENTPATPEPPVA